MVLICVQLEAAQTSDTQQQRQLKTAQQDLQDSQSHAQDLNDRLGASQVFENATPACVNANVSMRWRSMQ